MDWVFIHDGDEEIGAIAFIDRRAAVIASFRDHGPSNGTSPSANDTSAPLFDFECLAVLQVAMAARHNEIVQHWDGVFARDAEEMWLRFATGLAHSAIHSAYFSRGVNTLSRFQPGSSRDGMIRQYAIRRGMERAVERVYQSLGPEGSGLRERPRPISAPSID